MALMNKTATKSPASPKPLRVEDDAEQIAFAAKLGKLEHRKSRLVVAELALRESQPRSGPTPVMSHHDFEEAARKMAAAPPEPGADLPSGGLGAIQAARRVVDRAIELAQDEGRQVFVRCFNRVREARLPEWNEIVTRYARAVVEAAKIEKQRDLLFGEIGYGLHGAVGLPLSSAHLANGRMALSTLFDSAVAANLVTLEEVKI